MLVFQTDIYKKEVKYLNIRIMKERVELPGTFRIVTLGMAVLGLVVFIAGLLTDPVVTWGSYLSACYYFLSLSIGAAFFHSIQSITQSGWSSGFQRIPEAMMAYVPVAAVSFLLIYFGMHNLYHWAHEDVVAGDAVLQHKSPFLNVPFFIIRMIVIFALWIVFTIIIRRNSRQEDLFDPADRKGILTHFNRSELYSKIFIFIFAITFSLAAFDWIMSIEPHWYSTVFAFKNVAAAFLHGVSIIALIVFILHRRGYFPFLNEYHLHDFARYIFILSIIWGYLWFAQFIIIWYGNIPEETAFYFYRFQKGWKIMFYLQIILNWGVPFLILLPVKTSRNIKIITAVIIVLIIGQYVDLLVEIMPTLTDKLKLGWIEIGLFIGFAGLFAFVVGTALSKSKLIPQNHPYLQESIEHQFE